MRENKLALFSPSPGCRARDTSQDTRAGQCETTICQCSPAHASRAAHTCQGPRAPRDRAVQPQTRARTPLPAGPQTRARTPVPPDPHSRRHVPGPPCPQGRRHVPGPPCPQTPVPPGAMLARLLRKDSPRLPVLSHSTCSTLKTRGSGRGSVKTRASRSRTQEWPRLCARDQCFRLSVTVCWSVNWTCSRSVCPSWLGLQTTSSFLVAHVVRVPLHRLPHEPLP